MKKERLIIMAMFGLIIILFLVLTCQAGGKQGSSGNYTGNNGVAETSLSYSHGNKTTGGNSTGFSQSKYDGTSNQKVDTTANSFVSLSGKANEKNKNPNTQQNDWSYAEINSSVEPKSGGASLSIKGNAQQENWALLKNNNYESKGKNSFSVSYSGSDPNQAKPTSFSGNGYVLGWTTVKEDKPNNVIIGETYGEGQVDPVNLGQTNLKGSGNVSIEKLKGKITGNYSQSKVTSDFKINLPNPSKPQFGDAKVKSINILEKMPSGIFGYTEVHSYSETGPQKPKP